MPEYDEIAIREAIVNAIIHRQYTNVGAEVTIDIYDNRIVITSPGPMASGVLINKELEDNIPSIRRNPILADIFARMKFMDRRGSGFDKIVNGTNRLFDDNENHVEFYATETHFSVVIYNANFNDAQNDAQNEMENLIIRLIAKNKYITRLEMAEKIGKGLNTNSKNFVSEWMQFFNFYSIIILTIKAFKSSIVNRGII